MGTNPHYLTILQYKDLIRRTYRRYTLGNQECCHPLRTLPGFLTERPTECRVRGKIQRRSTVIQDQDLRIPYQCPCNGQALPLTAGQILPGLIQHETEAVFFLFNKSLRLRGPKRFP